MKKSEIKVIVDSVTGCWNWQRAKDSAGYGAVNLDGKTIRLHRLAAYLWHDVPLRGREVVRHTCDNPACFNPAHLVGGTQGENMRDCSDKGRIANSKKTVCKRGHPLTGDNLYIGTGTNRRSMRVCRECRKTRIKFYMRTKRQSALPHDPPV